MKLTWGGNDSDSLNNLTFPICHGALKHKAVRKSERSLYNAARSHFGSWHAARMAAGFDRRKSEFQASQDTGFITNTYWRFSKNMLRPNKTSQKKRRMILTKHISTTPQHCSVTKAFPIAGIAEGAIRLLTYCHGPAGGQPNLNSLPLRICQCRGH